MHYNKITSLSLIRHHTMNMYLMNEKKSYFPQRLPFGIKYSRCGLTSEFEKQREEGAAETQIHK